MRRMSGADGAPRMKERLPGDGELDLALRLTYVRFF
jgi:hypothetical protein